MKAPNLISFPNAESLKNEVDIATFNLNQNFKDIADELSAIEEKIEQLPESSGGAGERGEKGEKGDKGDTGERGTSAGFGNITASATQLPAGSQPSASVQASGDDTAKNLAFTFGIPKASGGGGGSEFSFDLLWENPNPSTSFAAQTVTNQNAGATANWSANTYKLYYVVFKQVNSGTAYAMFLYPTNGDFQLACVSLGWGNTTQYKRAISSATPTSMTFTIGRTNSNSATSNTDNAKSMVPYRIYGIK